MKSLIALGILAAALSIGSVAHAQEDAYTRARNNAIQMGDQIRQQNQAETDRHNYQVDHPYTPQAPRSGNTGEMRNVPPQAIYNGHGKGASRAE